MVIFPKEAKNNVTRQEFICQVTTNETCADKHVTVQPSPISQRSTFARKLCKNWVFLKFKMSSFLGPLPPSRNNVFQPAVTCVYLFKTHVYKVIHENVSVQLTVCASRNYHYFCQATFALIIIVYAIFCFVLFACFEYAKYLGLI